MAGQHHRWTGTWANSGRWWGTGKPGLLHAGNRVAESDTTWQLNNKNMSSDQHFPEVSETFRKCYFHFHILLLWNLKSRKDLRWLVNEASNGKIQPKERIHWKVPEIFKTRIVGKLAYLILISSYFINTLYAKQLVSFGLSAQLRQHSAKEYWENERN